jgi:hypothetical protein
MEALVLGFAAFSGFSFGNVGGGYRGAAVFSVGVVVRA